MAVIKLPIIFFYSENNVDSLNLPPNTNLTIVQCYINKFMYIRPYGWIILKQIHFDSFVQSTTLPSQTSSCIVSFSYLSTCAQADRRWPAKVTSETIIHRTISLFSLDNITSQDKLCMHPVYMPFQKPAVPKSLVACWTYFLTHFS